MRSLRSARWNIAWTKCRIVLRSSGGSLNPKRRSGSWGRRIVNAIEEYKELHERHEFLSSQHEDLVQAAGTLQGIIDELDEGMRRQFTEKFAEIRREFDKAFKELFGGETWNA